MIIECPNCGKKFKASDKLINGLRALPADDKMRLKCPSCFSLFGLRYEDLLASGDDAAKAGVAPPAAPDTSWLGKGGREQSETGAEELPTVLVLIKNEKMFTTVANAFEVMGYRVETAVDGDEAIGKMEFFLYAAVVLHTNFEKVDIANSKFHNFICGMDMRKRRQILYFLVGPEMSTMYDLEALCYSANQVVNDDDVEHFSVLARKLVREYEVLFGPLLRELELAGR